MSKSFIESLESRQLMSLTMDVRIAGGGGKTATVSKVGDVVHMEIWAIATGADNDGSNESLQIVDGSLLSTEVSGGAANGDLSAAVADPFFAAGSTNGNKVDLNGDGNIDVGSNDDSSANGFFFARADSLQNVNSSGVGTVNGASQSWEVGTLDYTVTSLRQISGSTDVNWRIRDFVSAGLWREDGVAILKNGVSGDIEIGAPVVIKTSVNGVVNTGGISGNVFGDTDGNGTKNGSESGDAGIIAYIDANKDGSLDNGEAQTQTDGSGNYSFTNLKAGTYRVRVNAPAGSHVTAPAAGFVDVSVSTSVVTGKNFGIKADSVSVNGSISGTVFNDGNKNGSLDAGDTLLSNRKMYIDANKNGKLDSGEKTAISNASGVYTFTNLTPGTYEIRRSDLPAGYSFTEPASGFYDVTVASGQNVTGKDFGAIQGTTGGGGSTASISGTVFSDNNNNGALDGGDTKLSARKMYIDANKNGELDSGEKTTTSNASGVYSFTGLAAGTYEIRRADLPAGYSLSDPVAGFYDVTVASGQAVIGKDFGAIIGKVSAGTGSISGTVFNDGNKNGKLDSGESLLASRKIFIDANNNGSLDAGEITAVSNASGVYTFSGLAAGTYIIRRSDLPIGYKVTDPAAGFYDITIVAGQVVTGKDIGAVLT